MNKVPPKLPLKEERNSSIELFRIIATFSVMVAHFNGWFLDMPNQIGNMELTFATVMQSGVRAGSCICVNLFLILSGWFGVKLKFRSIWNLGVMLFFIYVPFQLFAFYVNGEFTIIELLFSMLPFSGKGYYIQCYLMLLLLSPVINSFIVNHNRRSVLCWALLFLAVEFWYDIIRDDQTVAFNNGYSVMHFILMYMLGRSFSLYKDKVLAVKQLYWIIAYFFITVVLTIFYILGAPKCWVYSNPLVILSSFCLFAPFLYHSYYNKWVNWIAISTLPVFIMHCEGIMMEKLVIIDKILYAQYDYWMFCLIIFGVQVVVFAICVIYDKVRRLLTEPLTNLIYYKVNYLVEKIIIYAK